MTQLRTALILIDVQKGFDEPALGKRNNPEAEKNISFLLNAFRKNQQPIVHIQHLSKEPQSPLRPGQPGVDFKKDLGPVYGERIFQKTVNSAFIGTNLEAWLRTENIHHLVFVGFTTDHCVSTSVRMASNLGFDCTLVSDATATFERMGTAHKQPPELIHEMNLASLRGEFAKVVTTTDFIELASPSIDSIHIV